MKINKSNELRLAITKLNDEIAKLKQERGVLVQEMKDNALNLSGLNESKIELEKTIKETLELSDSLADEVGNRVVEYRQVIDSYFEVLEGVKKDIENGKSIVQEKKDEFDSLCLRIKSETARIGEESAKLERWKNDIDIYKNRLQKEIRDKGSDIKIILN